jgi:hypothetical protein
MHSEEGGPPRSEPEPPAEGLAGSRRARQRTSGGAARSGINWGWGWLALTRQPELELELQLRAKQPAASPGLRLGANGPWRSGVRSQEARGQAGGGRHWRQRPAAAKSQKEQAPALLLASCFLWLACGVWLVAVLRVVPVHMPQLCRMPHATCHMPHVHWRMAMADGDMAIILDIRY